MDDLGFTRDRDLENNFDLIGGQVMSDELGLEQRAIIDFYDVASRMGRSVADVFTGQAVLERGSANSDVFEE